MRHPLATRVLATIQRYRMIEPGDRVAVGVSGGGDSLALLLVLEDLRESLGISLLVLHLNHLLRGEAADADERFVQDCARAHGLECLVRREDVGEMARNAGANVEEQARKCRYAFFRDVVQENLATRAATAHTADDQAETVLGRLARGTGLRGLAGVYPVAGPIVRPFLEVRRSEAREYLAIRGQAWREDETNLDTTRLRTRMRQLLPALEAACGGGVVVNLARLAQQARVDEALLQDVVDDRFRTLVCREGTKLAIAAKDLMDPWPALGTDAARESLAARVVRRVAEEVQGNLRRLAANHVELILRLAAHGTSGDRLELPAGLVAERVLDRLVFERGCTLRQFTSKSLSYSYPVDPWAAGEALVRIAETGKRLRLKLIDWPAVGRETYPDAGALDADRLESPLVVRNWLPGDAYRPFGRRRREKLKRLLLERRVAGRDRVGWPVLTGGGKPLWSSRLPVAAEFAAGPMTRRALVVNEEVSESEAVKPVCDTRERPGASK